MKFLSTVLSALFLAAHFTCCAGGDDKPTKSLSSLGCWSYDMGYTYDLSEQILLLKHVDALSVKNLLIALVQANNKTTSLCFDENTGKAEGSLLVSSPKNSFFIFGQKNELNNTRKFIIKHLDIELVQKPLHLHIDNEQNRTELKLLVPYPSSRFYSNAISPSREYPHYEENSTSEKKVQ